MAILFFEEDIKFSLNQKNKYKKWLKEVADSENYKIKELNYIFCSDEYLYQINQQYLNHHTYTDIITFDNSEEAKLIEGDVFISIERIKENALREKNSFEKEMLRVMSHGLLHLMGYKDKNPKDKILMSQREDESISLFE
ncbi:rRNA maturation RNase YbeY [Aquiflexum balticum DSM 16537]|uniref:Endoribonuclease YbeY n=1 Tax=Aquiflexum balticum DSM 16537 TaxID=758820 RepID=A0A1W2H0N6_9BACT|nr:rRNA maturation RNase YbeY [Aquiflexum balticum]SMD42507.1 rRNA maturation RNase YbeY [Aquiflexum balticum DSM 16537]